MAGQASLWVLQRKGHGTPTPGSGCPGQPWVLGGGNRPDPQEPPLVATDHLSDLALPEHDHGKQVPGET